jgi:GAF domain-containing protein
LQKSSQKRPFGIWFAIAYFVRKSEKVRKMLENGRFSGIKLGHQLLRFLLPQVPLNPYIVNNFPQEYITGIGSVRVGTQCCGRAVEHKRPWVVTDMLTDPLFAEARAAAEASPIRAAFSVPVFDGDRVIGALACHYQNPHTPTPWDIERNESFAKLIGIALIELRGLAPHKVPIDDRALEQPLAS